MHNISIFGYSFAAATATVADLSFGFFYFAMAFFVSHRMKLVQQKGVACTFTHMHTHMRHIAMQMHCRTSSAVRCIEKAIENNL